MEFKASCPLPPIPPIPSIEAIPAKLLVLLFCPDSGESVISTLYVLGILKAITIPAKSPIPIILRIVFLLFHKL